MVRITVVLCGIAAFLGAVTVSSLGGGTGSHDLNAEQQVFQIINRARTAQGVPPVQQNAQLQAAARAHSELMASEQKLSHELPGEPILRNRLALAGARFHTEVSNRCA